MCKMGNWSIKKTDEREDRLRRLMAETGEKTKAVPIDVAMKHYLADLARKEQVAPEIRDELARELSTPWLPIERETSVGTSK